jgi:hypothetical protein
MRISRRRLPIPQHEFGFTPDTFNLIVETGLDGDRIAREREEADRARCLAEEAQAGLFTAKSKKRSRGADTYGHQIGHQKSKKRLEKIVTNSLE